jgi:hypothetical protein
MPHLLLQPDVFLLAKSLFSYTELQFPDTRWLANPNSGQFRSADEYLVQYQSEDAGVRIE